MGQLFGTILNSTTLIFFVPVMLFFSPLMTFIVLGISRADPRMVDLDAAVVPEEACCGRRGGGRSKAPSCSKALVESGRSSRSRWTLSSGTRGTFMSLELPRPASLKG